MGDTTAKDPVITPENLHVTGTETEQIGTKNLHVTSEPADAIADKVLGEGAPAENLHVTTEPAN
ncbi:MULTISPECIES: hypothetical protein [unclassified Streptomyces]|uniref:hypothetical protein n=1 Tax=unclassified Streptomyces TaxID=2593676 RepID=UPI0006F7DFA1|nr:MULTISPECIES: hypothetical protein [unclassified Streptomyces]KQX58016.1 hypothetical protein ASD33_26405 [Streptomyces sp. Root1304]KRA95400.1 hypothetical protein ASE09_28465 [Streptomyces sp. Root66D1]